jgi:hypothetical protein
VPHATLKLQPGVNQTETPVLNEAGFSTSNLIRFLSDPKLGGIAQKLGGWTRFYPNQISSVVRNIIAWQDTNNLPHLGYGTQNATGTYQSQLGVITNGVLSDATPRSITDNVTAAASATIGLAKVIITDNTTTNITGYDTVYIPVHISVGGLVLFGMYQCDPDGYISGTSYTVYAQDVFGNQQLATATSAVTTVPLLATTSGSSVVQVTLNNHGYVVGNTYPLLVPTTVGGITLYGNFVVQTVIDANNFTISASTLASGTTSASVNGGNARYVYGFGVGAIPSGTGYGIGGYGLGGYGTGTAVAPATGVPVSASNWSLDNWGEIMIAAPVTPPMLLTATSSSIAAGVGTLNFPSTNVTVDVGEVITVSGANPSTWNGNWTVTASTSNSVSFVYGGLVNLSGNATILVNNVPYQPLYQWNPLGGSPTATALPYGPPVVSGFFVAMPQRQIVAWGTTFTGVIDPLLVRWCDINNYNSWIGTVTNQAGSYRIPKGSRIVGALQGPQQGYIWTDLGIWSMQYINQPYVYSFNEIGNGCGLIARKAAATLNGSVYWMGPSQFFSLSGAGVQPLPCPLWDVIFQNLDQNNLDKIRVAVNSRFSEISWYYPTTTSNGEVAAYVKFNAVLNEWDFGSLSRTSWIDQSVLGPPIGFDPNLMYLYQHETSTDADGQAMPSFIQTGYFAIGDGDLKTFVDQIWPDMKWGYYGGVQNASVQLTFYFADYPGQTPQADGPYTFVQGTQFVSPRIRGRLLSIKISSNDVGSWWRLGGMRYRYAPDGKF